MGTTRFIPDRIRQTLGRLGQCTERAVLPVTDILSAEGVVWYEDITDGMALRPFGPDETWGGIDVNRLFRFTVTIPASMADQPVEIHLTTSREGNWDATNPQFLAYVNGNLIQGLDVNHREFPLTGGAPEGTSFRVDLIGWSGMHPDKAGLRPVARVINDDVVSLLYDMKVPWECAVLMDENSRLRGEILEYVDNAVNLLDLRQPGSPEFFESVKAAARYMKDEFYGKYCGQFNEAVVTAVGHTHIDVAWLWTLFQTEQKSLRTFSTMIRLMEKYPRFIFMSSQPQLYKYVRSRDPKLYEKIKAMAAAGRWEPEGAMWLEADCNISSGEGLVRQVIHGKRFFRDEFGVDSKILWLPDVFGYSAALPQILKKSGVDYFMTTKISWSESNRNPNDTFLWQGIDGTEILSYFVTTIKYPAAQQRGFSTYNGSMSASEHMGTWDKYHHKAINQDVLTLYGFGDGGGGSTAEMIEYARRFEAGIPGTPRLQFGTAGDFFRRLEKTVTGSRRLPKWVGELYLELHRGTYTSQANNKKFNRQSEFACANAEWLSVMAGRLAGMTYPAQAIDAAWEETLLLQFHDILPGSSIKEVYEQSDRQYAGILSSMNAVCRQAMEAIAAGTGVQGDRVTLFNPAAFPVTETAVIELPGGWENAAVKNGSGRLCPSQITADGRLVFLADGVPSKGYAVFTLEPAAAEQAPAPDYDGTLANGRVTLTFNGKGAITSVYDRIAGRELIRPNEYGCLKTYYEAPKSYDNWEISDYYDEQSWDVDDLMEARIVEAGPVCTVLRLSWNYLSSVLSQDIAVYGHTDRIDFQTHADWKEKNILLKAVLPLELQADKAAFDIQYGNVERPTHDNTTWQDAQFEVVAHKWADLSESAYGVSLLSSSKYGFSVKHGVMTVSLIKSTCSPDPDMDKKEHDFTYGVLPHEGGWRQAGVNRQGYIVNQPLMAVVSGGRSEGALPAVYSAVSADAGNIFADVVKQAYDGDGVVIRLYEAEGARTRTVLTLPGSIASLHECDLLEKNLCAAEFEGNTFTTELKPYEIKTYRVRFR